MSGLSKGAASLAPAIEGMIARAVHLNPRLTNERAEFDFGEFVVLPAAVTLQIRHTNVALIQHACVLAPCDLRRGWSSQEIPIRSPQCSTVDHGGGGPPEVSERQGRRIRREVRSNRADQTTTPRPKRSWRRRAVQNQVFLRDPHTFKAVARGSLPRATRPRRRKPQRQAAAAARRRRRRAKPRATGTQIEITANGLGSGTAATGAESLAATDPSTTRRLPTPF